MDNIKHGNKDWEYHQCWSWPEGRRCKRFIPPGSNYCNEHVSKFYTTTPIALPPVSGTYLTMAVEALNDVNINDILKVEVNAQEFDASTSSDIIDTYYANNIDWVMNYKGKYMLSDVHFRIHVNGTRNSIDLFYAMLHEVDPDFPLDPFRSHTATVDVCKTCKGYVWPKSTISPERIKRAAKQADIKAKIKLWLEGSKCKGGVEKRMVPE